MSAARWQFLDAVNIEVHGPELVSFDDTIAAIADAVGCGILRRAGYRAVRDTVPCGIPCRAGYRTVGDTMPGRPHPRLRRYPIAFNEVPPAAWRDALVGHGLPKVFAGTPWLQRRNGRNSATAQQRNRRASLSCGRNDTCVKGSRVHVACCAGAAGSMLRWHIVRCMLHSHAAGCMAHS